MWRRKMWRKWRRNNVKKKIMWRNNVKEVNNEEEEEIMCEIMKWNMKWRNK